MSTKTDRRALALKNLQQGSQQNKATVTTLPQRQAKVPAQSKTPQQTPKISTIPPQVEAAEPQNAHPEPSYTKTSRNRKPRNAKVQFQTPSMFFVPLAESKPCSNPNLIDSYVVSLASCPHPKGLYMASSPADDSLAGLTVIDFNQYGNGFPIVDYEDLTICDQCIASNDPLLASLSEKSSPHGVLCFYGTDSEFQKQYPTITVPSVGDTITKVGDRYFINLTNISEDNVPSLISDLIRFASRVNFYVAWTLDGRYSRITKEISEYAVHLLDPAAFEAPYSFDMADVSRLVLGPQFVVSDDHDDDDSEQEEQSDHDQDGQSELSENEATGTHSDVPQTHNDILLSNFHNARQDLMDSASEQDFALALIFDRLTALNETVCLSLEHIDRCSENVQNDIYLQSYIRRMYTAPYIAQHPQLAFLMSEASHNGWSLSVIDNGGKVYILNKQM